MQYWEKCFGFYPILYTRTCKNIPNENIIAYLSDISKNPTLNNDDRNFFPFYEECRGSKEIQKEKFLGLDDYLSEFYGTLLVPFCTKT